MDEDDIISVPFEEDDLDGSGTVYRTYRMDTKRKRIIGMIDGAEAAAQSIFKELQTKRFAYLLYDDQYGCDIFNKIGNSDLTEEYLDSDIPAMIEDCLLIDDLVTEVSDISFEIIDVDSVSIEFYVATIYGDMNMEGVLMDG